MTFRILTILGALALPATAFAHPGHITELGHGHAHWLALAILGGLAIAIAVWAIVRMVRTARSRAGETRT